MTNHKSYSVCVFTSTRADFGMLVPLLREIQNSPQLTLTLLVSGSHLSRQHGDTLDEVIHEGFTDYSCVDIGLDNPQSTDLSRVFSTAITAYSDHLKTHHPQLLIILGDRYEALAAAIAAYINKIPIAHIAGGETTEGAMDEAFRHSITKMARLHFTTTEVYRNRVIQLGENPNSVVNVGGLFVDNTKHLELLNREELFEQLKIPLTTNKLAAITYHPETLSTQSPQHDIQQIFEALLAHPTLFCFFSYANADDIGATINHQIDHFVAKYPLRSAVAPSLGRVKYLSLLSHADMVIGNSSSGIVEAPSFHIPSINIGGRQRGRVTAPSTIQCECDANLIGQAIDKALTQEFIDLCKHVQNPHGDGRAAQRMVKAIENKLKEGINNSKAFFDIPG